MGTALRSHYVAGARGEVEHLLFADDGWMLSSRDAAPEVILLQLLVFLLGVPLAWQKVRGGLEHEFVGNWTDIGRFEVGLSARRAVWLCE